MKCFNVIHRCLASCSVKKDQFKVDNKSEFSIASNSIVFVAHFNMALLSYIRCR